MQTQKLENKIDNMLSGMSENLNYVTEAVCELKSNLTTVSYLLFLANNPDSKDAETPPASPLIVS